MANPLKASSDRDLRHRSLYAPCSSLGRIRDDLRAVQMEPWSADHTRSRLPASLAREPNDTRNPPGHFSLRYGMLCSV